MLRAWDFSSVRSWGWTEPQPRRLWRVHERTLTANQLEFVNLIVDHLTEHGSVEAARLYESPFTDLTPHGPDALFQATEIDELLQALQAVRATAVAA